jgi:hypothetical protein
MRSTNLPDSHGRKERPTPMPMRSPLAQTQQRGPSIEFRISEVALAIDIERLKQQRHAALARSGSMPHAAQAGAALLHGEAQATSSSARSAYAALANLRTLRTETTAQPPGEAAITRSPQQPSGSM